MSRKKAQFKNLGTLKPGEWQVILAIDSGAIVLTTTNQEPMMISDGKLTTLVASMGGKTVVQTEES